MRGIALEGGGAKGSFQIGAMKALRDLGIDYEVIAGTSIGAINGAMIAEGKLDFLESLWLTLEMKDMIEGDTEMLKKIMALDIKVESNRLKHFFSEMFRQGGLDVTPFKEKLYTYVDEDALRKSNVDFGLVTVSLSAMKPIELFVSEIPEGKLHDYIIASANLPAFKDEKLDNKKMLDGAFFDNLPVNMLLKRGCDEVIAIRLMGFGRIRKIPKEHQDKVITIMPSEDLGKLLEIDKERAKHNIKLGYFDTMRAMKKLHGYRYYISDMEEEAYFLNRFISITEETLSEISKFLNMDKPGHRMMFEQMIPLIGDLLKAERTDTYGQMILRYYEFLAEQAGIDRFEIMGYQTFVKRVNAHYLSQVESYKGIQEEIVKRLLSALPNKSITLLPSKLKNELLTHIYHIILRGFVDSGIYS
jgi:NTE family protein